VGKGITKICKRDVLFEGLFNYLVYSFKSYVTSLSSFTAVACFMYDLLDEKNKKPTNNK